MRTLLIVEDEKNQRMLYRMELEDEYFVHDIYALVPG